MGVIRRYVVCLRGDGYYLYLLHISGKRHMWRGKVRGPLLEVMHQINTSLRLRVKAVCCPNYERHSIGPLDKSVLTFYLLDHYL